MSAKAILAGRSASHRLAAAVVALLVAAVAVLAFEAGAIWSTTTSGRPSRQAVTSRAEFEPSLAPLIHPGAHRGQVRFGPLAETVKTPHRPNQRPKWGVGEG